MPKIPTLIKKVRTYTHSLSMLESETGVGKTTLWKLKKMKPCKYKKNTLDVLYQFFEIEKDEFYDDQMKKRYPPTFSVIGNILRQKRIEMGLSIAEVAKRTKGEKRQLFRIEAGDSLPAFNSWYMTQLLDLYKFDDEERNKIMWGIAILKDLIKINNKYDQERDEIDPTDGPGEKGHGKKTVTRI